MNISNNDLQNCNWWLKRLDTQLNEQTNQKYVDPVKMNFWYNPANEV